MNVLGILLAGGMGTRLKELTDTVPKPAIHFGGKYRIIDFSLSNCSNSGIDTLGIITQYEPIALTSYIGNGAAWDLDILNGGVTVLPPYTSKTQGYHWQNGTAHAVYQHLNYMELYHPDVVLILSTDHIYKMDYRKLIDFHLKNEADLTISSLEVPESECYRFGILETTPSFQIKSFEEKPKQPKGNCASMGIYVFNYEILKSVLMHFNTGENAEVDFGKHIIPYMIQDYKVYSYPFKGYWQDIGTLQSLWQANMDLIDHPEFLNLSDNIWPIFSNNIQMPPHHVFTHSFIRQSYICEGSLILGNVEHSLISHQVLIGENSTIMNAVIMPNVTIGKNCFIKNAIVQMNLTIPDFTIFDHGDAENVLLITEKLLSEVKK